MPSLIVFSHLRWNFVQARPQHLLARLASHYRVLYVEEPLYGPGAARLEHATPVEGIELLRPRTPLALEGFRDEQIALLKPLLPQYGAPSSCMRGSAGRASASSASSTSGSTLR